MARLQLVVASLGFSEATIKMLGRWLSRVYIETPQNQLAKLLPLLAGEPQEAHMRRRLRQNATNVSEIYVGLPIYISDIRYLYPTSDIPALALAEVGYCISDVRYRYWTSDIYILDVQYRFQKYWCHFVSNSAP